MTRKQIVKKDIWERIKEHQKNPEYIRAAYEFIRLTTGKSPK